VNTERLLLTGASQGGRDRRAHMKALESEGRLGELYRTAVLMEIDFAAKRIVRRLQVGPEQAGARPDGYATNFTVPCRLGDRLLVPSHATIFEVDLASFAVESTRSMRLLNDMHHVVVRDGDVYAVSTGLDRIVILRGDQVEAIPTTSDAKPLDPETDYRHVNTKPHVCHPNYLTFVDGEPWVTRAIPHDWAPLSNLAAGVPLSQVAVHDGSGHEGLHYFTAVKGQVIVVDPRRRAVVDRLDLVQPRGDYLTGWCRGILVTDEYYYVGYSVLRRTRYVENLQWLKAKLLRKCPPLPTRIEKVDRRDGAVVDEFVFEPEDLSAIFWIDTAGDDPG